ncbi:MAG TPA: hypothetical protein VIL98_07765 [Gaiellaceae bacterium]
MVRRSLLVLAAASLAVVAAGCGARSNKPFTAKGTAACMTKKGFTKVTTNPLKVGFIAGFADNGGLRATTTDGKLLTIAFSADDTAGVASTKQAFRTHAPAKLRPRMNDIMESQRNAVLVWTVSPTPSQLADAMSCLHP